MTIISSQRKSRISGMRLSVLANDVFAVLMHYQISHILLKQRHTIVHFKVHRESDEIREIKLTGFSL